MKDINAQIDLMKTLLKLGLAGPNEMTALISKIFEETVRAGLLMQDTDYDEHH